MAVIAKSARGTEGRITLPGMGALIGEIFSWQAYSEDNKTYVLKLSCNATFHESLWEAAGDERRIEINLGRDSWYEAKLVENASIVRNGRNLTIKTVTFEELEKH